MLDVIKFQDNKIAQLEFGTDAIVQQKTGRKFSVEYKTKRYALKKFNQWPLEIKHHLYLDEDRRYQIKSKEGWLYRSTADYIVFGTLNEEKNKIIEACAITLSPFKSIYPCTGILIPSNHLNASISGLQVS